MVEMTEFVNCSRNQRASRRISLFKYELPFLLRAAKPASQTKTLHRQLEGFSSDLPAHIVPSAPQEATKILG